MIKKRLNEAIQVEGAEFIATSRGFDLFNITTYNAAQQFIVSNANDLAGSKYIGGQDIFDNNIDENTHLYFFTEEDTNHVVLAAVSDTNSHRTKITLKGKEINFTANYLFEDKAYHGNQNLNLNDNIIPFYSLPNFQTDVFGFMQDGEVMNDEGELIALCGCFTPELQLNYWYSAEDEDVRKLKTGCFDCGVKVHNLVLEDCERLMVESNITENVDQIALDVLEKPEDWPNDWNRGKENVTIWGFDLTPEEREEIKRESEEAERLEHERIAREEEERQREEEERARLEAERAAHALIYKIEGKEVTILGMRGNSRELTIPATINGKPVTKIAAQAFYDKDSLRTINFEDPSQLKMIERGAFANCTNLYLNITVPSSCIVGKYYDWGSPDVMVKKA